MGNTSITTPGSNNVIEPKQPQSPEVEPAIREKLLRAIGSNEPRSPEAIVSTTKRFLGSLTPDERASLERAIYSKTPDVSTVGTEDRNLTGKLNAVIQQRGMLSPGCTGGRDITVHVINNPETEKGPMVPAIVADRAVVIPRETIARTPPGQGDSILAVVGHEIGHGREQDGLKMVLNTSIRLKRALNFEIVGCS
jgi:hypothetical protein